MKKFKVPIMVGLFGPAMFAGDTNFDETLVRIVFCDFHHFSWDIRTAMGQPR